jgi:hypothetical protein
MSEHALPDDPSDWPDDPFELLGVEPGVSPRDLRRAYLALIRRYKPEHAPDEFRRIREAFEAAQRYGAGRVFRLSWADAGDDEPAGPGALTTPVPEPLDNESAAPPSDHAPAPRRVERPEAPELWDLACGGDETSAYRGLKERLDRGRVPEEIYLQLYWLLVAAPALEPGLEPGDWLVRGLRACGPMARRLRELLRREAAADPSGAVGERLAALLAPDTPAELVLDAADRRWRAARVLGRWALILGDVKSLRSRPCADDAEAWVRTLLAAAGNAVWALGAARDAARVYLREAEQLARDHALDIAEELNRLEYAESVMKGLARLDLRGVGEPELHRLLALSWDDRGPGLQPRLLAFFRPVVRDPRGALARFDVFHAEAPAALGLLWELTGGSVYRRPDAGVADTAEAFLASSRWWDYKAFRQALLPFCLREVIAPDVFARAVVDWPEYVLNGQRLLAHEVASDWPMLLVYRACELSWE